MSVDFRPFRDGILVKKNKPSEFKGDVYVGTTKQSHEGKVIATGEGRLGEDLKEIIPLKVDIGDTVVWRPGSGFKLDAVETSVDDADPEAEYILLREIDIVGFRLNT